MNAGEQSIKIISDALQSFGLDIVQPFDVAAYNALSTIHPSLTPIPDFNRGHALGLLIGNTRELWPPFVAAYSNSPGLSDEPDPLDRYVETAIINCLQQLPCAVELRLGHHRATQLVSLVHLAEISKLATVSPVQLAVHAEYGLWFGLRAALILDADFTDIEIPEPGGKVVSDGAESPCIHCDAPCKATLERLTPKDNQSTQRASWTRWVEVRDACPVGRQHRYSDQQVNYHHSKNRDLLIPLQADSKHQD